MDGKRILQMVVTLIIVAAAAVAVFAPAAPGLPVIKDIPLGLDLQGGVHVVLQAVGTPEAPVTPDSMKRVQAIIANRVNGLGVSEPVIQLQGSDRLLVDLAGVKNPDQVIGTLIKPAFLEFKNEAGQDVLTGADLQDAQESTSPGGEPVVDLTLTAAGAKKFDAATKAAVAVTPHQTIAIYLDGKLLSKPRVDEEIPNGKAEIHGGFATLQDAHNLAVLLRSGALPVKLSVLESRTVGPTLGADSLSRSIRAGIVGVIAIFLFMLLYYRMPGLVADFALIIYTLIMVGIFAALRVTLTLPDIAGFLLSVGIAVDANVIIFERFREELRSGRSVRSAIDAGFKRGFTAVFDSNATTLIVAAVLYYFGTGEVKGFAVTLGLGILVSLFTAVVITRWLLHVTAEAGLVKNNKIFFGVEGGR